MGLVIEIIIKIIIEITMMITRVRWHTLLRTSGKWSGSKAVSSLSCSQSANHHFDDFDDFDDDLDDFDDSDDCRLSENSYQLANKTFLVHTVEKVL